VIKLDPIQYAELAIGPRVLSSSSTLSRNASASDSFKTIIYS
jgi:hypothetical protein